MFSSLVSRDALISSSSLTWRSGKLESSPSFCRIVKAGGSFALWSKDPASVDSARAEMPAGILPISSGARFYGEHSDSIADDRDCATCLAFWAWQPLKISISLTLTLTLLFSLARFYFSCWKSFAREDNCANHRGSNYCLFIVHRSFAKWKQPMYDQ